MKCEQMHNRTVVYIIHFVFLLLINIAIAKTKVTNCCRLCGRECTRMMMTPSVRCAVCSGLLVWVSSPSSSAIDADSSQPSLSPLKQDMAHVDFDSLLAHKIKHCGLTTHVKANSCPRWNVLSDEMRENMIDAIERNAAVYSSVYHSLFVGVIRCGRKAERKKEQNPLWRYFSWDLMWHNGDIALALCKCDSQWAPVQPLFPDIDL